MESLSAVIKKRRKELGLTLSQIAEQMGVAEATVQRWESGNIKSIRYDKITKLAEILKVTPATIMGWDEETYNTLYNLATDMSCIEEFKALSEEDKRRALDSVKIPSLHDYELRPQETCLIYAFRALNPEGQEKLLDYADDLVQSGKYIKSDSSELGAAEG